MDLALSPDDEAFARSLRDWLDEHLDAPPAFHDLADEVAWGRRWQATLAADRWVGVHWPEAYGGRGVRPVQVAIYQPEYARSMAPQPVNRVGINLVGPTLLAHGTEEQRRAGCRPSCRPTRSGASCSASPTPGATWPPSAPGPSRSTAATW